ncbi:SH3 domain-containing protein [Yoonia sp.]|uniref:SH3 domain-containing protein n=1 Tax=Yoonia sp. TaxID=2212373 RepID=UPI0023A0DCB7|nr:SH3 domain-containing protein [Yoonia sp.]MDE0849970.1 SH3 domain-containing protein [Yoonia sp.]
MNKFIIMSFLVLGVVFYEMSGGGDFVSETRIVTEKAQIVDEKPIIETTDVSVSRNNAASLMALNPTVTTVSLDTAPVTEQQPVAIQVATPAAEAPIPETVVEVVTAVLDIRAVAGSRVNMRQGPGTNFPVLDTLDGGTQAEVLEINANGWAQIEVLNTGQIGWMSTRLLISR